MYIKLGLFIFLSCTWLQGMQEEKSILSLLPKELISELRKYAPTRLDQLPQEIQKELISFVVTDLIQAAERHIRTISPQWTPPKPVLPNWSQLEQLVLNPLRPYFGLPIFLKNIETVLSLASQGKIEYFIRIAAAINIPAVTEWLKKQVTENEAIRKQAHQEFDQIVYRNLGQAKSLHAWNKDKPEEQETADEKQKKHNLEKLLYITLENLLKAGVDINLEGDHTKESPLMNAAHYCDVATVQFLLERGAKRALKNRDGSTALDMAETHLKAAQDRGAHAAIKRCQKVIEILKEVKG